jgi:hypothetical protein
VGLTDAWAQLETGLLPGFTETIRGVITSVHEALERAMPDEISVEFGIEISARAGKAVSILADAGGGAHVNVVASWSRDGAAGPKAGTADRKPGAAADQAEAVTGVPKAVASDD